MLGSTPPPIARRRRIIELCHRRIATATHMVRRRYRTSLADIDLSLQDLVQFGSIKAMECYDALYASEPATVLDGDEEALKERLVKFGLHCIACHIIDVYRQRDGRRETIAPEALLIEVDESDTRRMELFWRLSPVMDSITARQRHVVAGLWRGLEADEIAVEAGCSTNVVYKEIARIRATATRIAA